MTVSLETVSIILLLILNIIALYVIIKNVGAKDMETKKEIDALKEHVSALEQKVAVAESCTAENEKSITGMQKDIDWIKKGIDEIKHMLEGK